MTVRRMIALLSIAAATSLTACADGRYEGEGFSFEPAAEWEVAEPGDVQTGAASGAPIELVATLEPASDANSLGQVDVYRATGVPTPPGADEETTLSALVAGLGLGADATGGEVQEPEMVSLGDQPAAEVAFTTAAMNGVLPAGRVVVAKRDETIYIVTQAGVDSAELAEYAVGFDSVVDSWEWE
ncbi:hypothetical protein HJD18_01445 [Thermoleophilia bacterium SCSIO 60948]|nr:hypothetical protein HJD18_01445 [Thermoleophilia bacterium SCSIO 60948]